MHTVRNRVASRPRVPAKAKPPAKRNSRREPAFLLKNGNPPAFPPGLIIPPPRGAVIAAIDWPDAPKIERTVTRKAAARKQHPSQQKSALPKHGKPKRKAAKQSKPQRPLAASGPLAEAARPQSVDIMKGNETLVAEDLLTRALAIQPPSMPDAPIMPKVVAAAAPDSVDAAKPLHRSRALTAPGGHGLFGSISHWLQGAGRWLSQWRAQQRRSAAERARLAQARARHRALQSQFEALEALKKIAPDQSA